MHLKVNLSNRLSAILFAGFAIVMLLMAITLTITIQNSSSVKQHTRSALQIEIPQMLQLMNLEHEVYESLNNLNQFLLSGEMTDRAHFYESMNKLQTNIDKYVHPEITSSDAVKNLFQHYQKKSRHVIKLREDDQKNYLGIAKASELLNPYHQQFISNLDNIIINRLSELEKEDSQILIQLTKIRNSWNNMIMGLRIYFTTRGDRDYRRIFLYQEQNIKDMNALLEIKTQLDFDELFVDELADIHKTYMENLPKVLEVYQTDKWRLDTYIIRNEIYPLTTSLTHIINLLVTEQKKMTEDESRQLSDELNSLTSKAISAFAISLLIGLLVIYVVIRNIRNIFKELEQSQQESLLRSEMLQKTLEILQTTQTQLVEHEKMAALGNLVAGMAHEINTPIGVGVTASSHISDTTDQLEEKFKKGAMTKEDFTNFIQDTKESNNIMSTNLARAADLISSFKQIAVDQTSEELREFELCDYLHEVYNSLIPTFKKTKIKTIINCDENVYIKSFPGALAQVLTNLMMNSLIHGYDEGEAGDIIINAFQDDKHNVILYYEDNGKGMDKNTLDKIFDPFFTTKRGKGGSGLGMHLLYNLITQKLLGKVHVESSLNKGVKFSINFPARIQEKE